jgi:hypothetical protein
MNLYTNDCISHVFFRLGTVLDLPHTPQNVRVFGKRHSPRGTRAWPQARVLAISECSTHVVLEEGVWPHDFHERAAGKELVVAYHWRWEFELAIEELKSHQRAPHMPVRSKIAVGVVQEIYGLLIAH